MRAIPKPRPDLLFVVAVVVVLGVAAVLLDRPIAIVALFVALTVLALIGWHLWTRQRTRESKSNLGAALLGGLVVGFTVLIAQLLIQTRSDEAAEQRSLQLLVGLQKDLTGVDLHGRDLRGFFLRDKTLRFAQLEGTDLSGADLYGADLSHANLARANLQDAGLPYTKLFSANLSEADLRSATLVNANAREANLSDANLVGTDLRGTDRRGAAYDDGTTWPRNFDPATRGLVNMCELLPKRGMSPEDAGVTCD